MGGSLEPRATQQLCLRQQTNKWNPTPPVLRLCALQAGMFVWFVALSPEPKMCVPHTGHPVDICVLIIQKKVENASVAWCSPSF